MHLLSREEAIEFVSERADLFDESSNPFAGSEWTVHFLREVAAESWTIHAPEYFPGGHSLMLLYSERGAPHRRQALTNYYASLYSPLISPVRGPGRAAAMAAMVEQAVLLRPRAPVMQFAPLDADCPDTAALRLALRQQGWHTRQYDCFGNWHLPCDGLTFDAYMGQRDSKTRNTVARKTKQFLAAGELQIATTEADVEAAMDAFDRVYAKSWKQAEPYPNFVRGWARICARNGWLRLGVASIDGAPIAAQFWFTIGRHAYIFKLAYDEAHARWSAGTVLSAHLFRQALDVDRVVEIDYLTGDDAYKQAWMTHRRQRVGIIASNPRSLRGLAVAAREIAGELRQRWRAAPA